MDPIHTFVTNEKEAKVARDAAKIVQAEIKKSKAQATKWGSQGKNKKKALTAEVLAAIILASTEGLKIAQLKKMTKSLRDQANKGYRENKANKKEQ